MGRTSAGAAFESTRWLSPAAIKRERAQLIWLIAPLSESPPSYFCAAEAMLFSSATEYVGV